MSTTCTSSDCLDLDLNTTEYNQTIKFQIQSCTTSANICYNSSVITIRVVSINNPPELESGGKDISTQLIIGSQDVLEIPLPKTSDQDNDTVALSFINLPSYVSYNNLTGLKLDLTKFTAKDYSDLKGNLVLKGFLADSRNATSTFTYNIQLL